MKEQIHMCLKEINKDVPYLYFWVLDSMLKMDPHLQLEKSNRTIAF